MGEDDLKDLALPEAEEKLREHGGYDWLLSSTQQFWSVSEIVAEFEKVGMKVGNDAVVRWVKPLEHTQDFGGPIGLRAARRDLIRLFASRMGEGEKPRTRKKKRTSNAE
jgi:hypothetical protein